MKQLNLFADSWSGVLSEHPFPDIPLGMHWHTDKDTDVLWDKDSRVGRTYYMPFSDMWVAEAYWLPMTESLTYCHTEEEAKAYLITTYRFQR